MGQLPVRYGKALVLECLVAVNQQVQVQCAWSPVLQAFATVGLFNRLEVVKQGMGRQFGAQPDCTIDKIRLIRWADRPTGVKG